MASPASSLRVVEDLTKLDSIAKSLSLDKQHVNEITLKSLQRLHANPFNGSLEDMAVALEKLSVWYSQVAEIDQDQNIMNAARELSLQWLHEFAVLLSNDGSLMAQLISIQTLNFLLAKTIYDQDAKASIKSTILRSRRLLGTKTAEKLSDSLIENMEILKILIHLSRQFATNDDPTIVSFDAHIPRLVTEINSKLQAAMNGGSIDEKRRLLLEMVDLQAVLANDGRWRIINYDIQARKHLNMMINPPPPPPAPPKSPVRAHTIPTRRPPTTEQPDEDEQDPDFRKDLEEAIARSELDKWRTQEDQAREKTKAEKGKEKESIVGDTTAEKGAKKPAAPKKPTENPRKRKATGAVEAGEDGEEREEEAKPKKATRKRRAVAPAEEKDGKGEKEGAQAEEPSKRVKIPDWLKAIGKEQNKK